MSIFAWLGTTKVRRLRRVTHASRISMLTCDLTQGEHNITAYLPGKTTSMNHRTNPEPKTIFEATSSVPACLMFSISAPSSRPTVIASHFAYAG